MNSYVADFETITKIDDCRVWLWGVTNINNLDEFYHGPDIQSFIEFTQDYGGEYYFHNLSFDGSFILDYLLTHGYEWTEVISGPSAQVETLISLQNQFYQIVVKHRYGKRVTIKDSLKKLPFSVSTVAETFNLNMTKGDIDYHAERPVGYKPNAVEIDYVCRDVAIVAQALRIQQDKGLDRLTVGSDALYDYQTMTPGHANVFPILPLDVDSDIRRAYRGGFTYANPKYQNQVINGGASYDVNSLYPYIMYDRPLPYGVPIFFDGAPEHDNEYPLWIASITIEATLKPGCVPCIQLKNTPGYSPTEYIDNTVEPTDINVTNVDWELINDHYHVTIVSYNGGWKFLSRNDMFRAYIDKWSHVKQNSEGGERTLAKLMLNSLYGKYATNPDITGRYPEMIDGILHLSIGPEELRDPVYTAAGVFITSWARDYTIRSAQALGDRFLYADTDSLHIIGTETPDLWIDPKIMGAWKHEYNFTRARYVRAKCYAEELADGSHVVRVAGLPESARTTATVDTLLPGAVFQGKLRPKHVPGGIVLIPVEFTIK